MPPPFFVLAAWWPFPRKRITVLRLIRLTPRPLERLFFVKQRPRRLPILVLVAGMDQLPLLTGKVPAVYRRLIDCFWPGPLTLVCPALPLLPPQLTGKTGTIALRHSPNETANALIGLFGGPITATSANITGFPAAVTAEDVARIFDSEIDLILDGGPTPGGSGSTLVGIDKGTLFCIREGKIGFSAVQDCTAALALHD